MSALQKMESATVADYMSRVDGRWELIDGEFWDMSPAPSAKHQWLAMQIAFEIQSSSSCKERCKAFVSPVDYVVDERTVLQPDVAVFCVDGFPKNFTSAPIFVAEVLSKSTAIKDRNIKLKIYEKERVPYFLIVEPNSEFAELFTLKSGAYTLEKSLFFGDKEYFKFESCEFSIDFSKVFTEGEE